MANASSSYSSISCSSYSRLHPCYSSDINNLQLAFRSSLLYPNLVQVNTNKNGSFSNLSFQPLPPKNKTFLCMRRPLKAAVVTGGSWNTAVLDSKFPVLVEFYASWCGPCQMVHRVIDEIAAEYAGKIKCFVLNADKDPLIAEEYDIKAVPVVLLFKNGEKCGSVVGTMPKEFYVAAIERALSSSS